MHSSSVPSSGRKQSKGTKGLGFTLLLSAATNTTACIIHTTALPPIDTAQPTSTSPSSAENPPHASKSGAVTDRETHSEDGTAQHESSELSPSLGAVASASPKVSPKAAPTPAENSQTSLAIATSDTGAGPASSGWVNDNDDELDGLLDEFG